MSEAARWAGGGSLAHGPRVQTGTAPAPGGTIFSGTRSRGRGGQVDPSRARAQWPNTPEAQSPHLAAGPVTMWPQPFLEPVWPPLSSWVSSPSQVGRQKPRACTHVPPRWLPPPPWEREPLGRRSRLQPLRTVFLPLGLTQK